MDKENHVSSGPLQHALGGKSEMDDHAKYMKSKGIHVTFGGKSKATGEKVRDDEMEYHGPKDKVLKHVKAHYGDDNSEYEVKDFHGHLLKESEETSLYEQYDEVMDSLFDGNPINFKRASTDILVDKITDKLHELKSELASNLVSEENNKDHVSSGHIPELDDDHGMDAVERKEHAENVKKDQGLKVTYHGKGNNRSHQVHGPKKAVKQYVSDQYSGYEDGDKLMKKNHPHLHEEDELNEISKDTHSHIFEGYYTPEKTKEPLKWKSKKSKNGLDVYDHKDRHVGTFDDKENFNSWKKKQGHNVELHEEDELNEISVDTLKSYKKGIHKRFRKKERAHAARENSIRRKKEEIKSDADEKGLKYKRPERKIPLTPADPDYYKSDRRTKVGKKLGKLDDKRVQSIRNRFDDHHDYEKKNRYATAVINNKLKKHGKEPNEPLHHNVNEDELNEISKDTLKSYSNKGHKKYTKLMKKSWDEDDTLSDKEKDDIRRKTYNLGKYTDRAERKIHGDPGFVPATDSPKKK